MSSILLTNRFGHKENFWLTTPMLFFYQFALIFFIALFIKGCNTIPNEKPNLHGARQFFPIDVDTVKPKPIPKVNHNLVLRGSDTLFNVLWTQIISPQDVTPRNLAILQKWVQSNTVQDTITIKK